MRRVSRTLETMAGSLDILAALLGVFSGQAGLTGSLDDGCANFCVELSASSLAFIQISPGRCVGRVPCRDKAGVAFSVDGQSISSPRYSEYQCDPTRQVPGRRDIKRLQAPPVVRRNGPWLPYGEQQARLRWRTIDFFCLAEAGIGCHRSGPASPPGERWLTVRLSSMGPRTRENRLLVGAVEPTVASDVTVRMVTISHHPAPIQSEAKHPGALLRDYVLPGLRLSVTQAARDLAVTRQTLHRILAGNAAISTEMAARLEIVCGVSSRFWLDCQHRYELQRAKTELASVLACVRSRALPEQVFKTIGGSYGH